MRIPGQEPLTASMLAAAPLHEQKQMIGEWPVPLLWSRKQGVAERWPAWWEKPRMEVRHVDKVQRCCRPTCWVTLLGLPLLSRPPSLSRLKMLSVEMVPRFPQLCCPSPRTGWGEPSCGQIGGQESG